MIEFYSWEEVVIFSNEGGEPMMLIKMGEIVARELWRNKVIQVNVKNPWTLVSGKKSPIYIDCRRVISFPYLRDLFVTAARQIIDIMGLLKEPDCRACSVCGVGRPVDVIAGGETAGIPFAAFLAQSLNLPMVYVRKEPKGHGSLNLIEGNLPEGSNVLLVEDLITDGGSKLVFTQGIERAGSRAAGVLVLFDRQQGGKERLTQEQIPLFSVTDMVIALGSAGGSVLPDELEEVGRYLDDPDAWESRYSGS